MSRGHILILDDERTILSTLQKTLTLEGYSVDVAGGVRVAEEKIQKTSYDLGLFDVALPDGNGVALLERLRASHNDFPVVMMSGHATVDVAVKATRLGAFDFLEKPLSTDRLLLVVDNALRLARVEEEARELRSRAGQGDLLGKSRVMTQLREQIERAAKATANVLLIGERGTGKELVARAIHVASKRATLPLEKMNCAAIPTELFESELFGHEVGAFTGATKQRRGKFERASGGTLFLDEIGDMPFAMQAKLLRVLQEREIERVGGSEVIRVDVRVIAATNRDLEQLAEEEKFRPDLFDRLNVLPLQLPPLRARREDIPELVSHFLRLCALQNDRSPMTITEGAMQILVQHSFPGNVRELRNVIERLVILTPDDRIDVEEVRACLGSNKTPTTLFRPGVPFRLLVEEAERTILEQALANFGGHMAPTARGLGLERSHLYKKCRALGLRRDQDADEGEGP